MNKNKNYERNVIKLGNSMAITFPQEWFSKTNLKEHSKVIVYPFNDDTLIIHSYGYKEELSELNLDIREWPSNLIEQVILTAFKLNIEKLYLKYNFKDKQDYYNLINKLQRKIIGFDSNFLNGDDNEICIRFLLDTSQTTLPEIIVEIFNMFKEFMETLIENNFDVKKSIFIEKFARKYYLGMRILLGTLNKYPNMEQMVKRPIIRTLGDRISILYAKQVMDYAYQLIKFSKEILTKYSDLLIEISNFFLLIIKGYNDIKLETLWEFQNNLDSLKKNYVKIKYDENPEEINIWRIIDSYFNILDNLMELTITRVIESNNIANLKKM